MNPRPKILYIITQDEWGGAQRYVFDLVSALARQFEITVAVGGQKTDYGLSQHILDSKVLAPEALKKVGLVRAVSLSEDWHAVSELKELVFDLKPDIIHLNSSKASIIGSLAVKKIPQVARPKVIYTVHGWVFDEPILKLKKTFYRWLEKKTAKYKDAIIVLSDKDKKSGENLGLGEKLSVIPHGVSSSILPLSREEAQAEVNKFLKDPSGATIEAKRPWFITIANAYKTKGIDTLIAAIAQKKKELSEASFFIIGGGPELKDLEQNTEKLKLNNIYFSGFLPFAAKLLRAFDAFVLPSRKEGLPYAILEALQAHIPIIATNVGGIPEIIENKKSGLLVNPDAVGELAEALVWAVEHPTEMKQFADTAAAHTSLSLETMVKKTTSLYQQLLQRH